MKLLSVHIENFGKLCNFDRDFIDGLNYITEENGWGKTTFSVFVLAMFYGFDDKTTKKYREIYAPWNGGVYGGNLIFKVNGKSYEVTRTFGKKRATDDTFSITDADTLVSTSDFDEYLGDELFGINAESFMKTAFMGNGGPRTSVTDDINAKIGDVSMIYADMKNFSAAQKSLKDYINKNSDERKTGTLSKLKSEISENLVKSRFAGSIKNELLDVDNTLVGLRNEKKSLENKNEEVLLLQSKIVKCKEASLTYEKYKNLLHMYEKAMADREKESDLNLILPISLFIVGLMLSAAGIALSVLQSIFVGILIIFAGIIMIMLGIMFTKKREVSLTKEENIKTQNCSEAEYEYMNFVSSVDVNELQRLSEMPEAAMSLKSTDDERKNILQSIDNTDAEIKKLEKRREFLLEELTISENSGEKAKEQSEQFEDGLKRLSYAKQALEFLEKAKTSFSLKFIEPVREGFGKYFSGMVKGADEICKLSANYEISISEAGANRPEEAFSDGIRDTLGIAMRLTLMDAMYLKEKPFLIMDDPFVHMDSEKTEAAIDVLKRSPYQIIIMSKT